MMRGSGKTAHKHGVATENPVQFTTCGFCDLFLCAAGKEAPRKPRDGGIARGVGRGDPSLRSNPRREVAGDQRYNQKNDHCDNVGDVVHLQRVKRLGEEEIIRPGCSEPSGNAWSDSPQSGRSEHCGKIDHVDRGGSPSRRQPQAGQRRDGDHRQRSGIGLNARGKRRLRG